MCLSPITLRNCSNPHKPIHSILVPCGKCVECLQNYQNSWFVRFYFEAISHSKAVFFTLTYAPENVPEFVDSDGVVYRTVYKKHIQDWLKRIRHDISEDFKYFITSEYGPKTARPHYHGVFFGLNKEDISKALYDWQTKFGFTQSRDINLLDLKDVSSSLRYIAKYCNKEEFENPNINTKVYKTFHLISKGLGLSWIHKYKDYILKHYYGDTLDDWIDNIINRSVVNIGGFNYALPRYYKVKLYGQKTLLSARIADKLVARNDDLFDKQLQVLQAENPDSSPYRSYHLHKLRSDSQKYEKLAKRQADFYNNSKI